MSVLLTSEDRISENLVVIFSSSNVSEQLFLAALEWTTTKHRKTHYVRRSRCERNTVVPKTCFVDPARYKRIRFYYREDYPLEKASKLSVDYSVRTEESLIIVETDRESYLEESAVSNTLAVLAAFSSGERRSIVSFFTDENLMMLASLFTKHIYIVDDYGCFSNIQLSP